MKKVFFKFLLHDFDANSAVRERKKISFFWTFVTWIWCKFKSKRRYFFSEFLLHDFDANSWVRETKLLFL